MASTDPGTKLNSLSADGKPLGLKLMGKSISDPRRLRKAMMKSLPAECRENQELVPGGDLRLTGNKWLRDAFKESRIQRVPREAEVRKVVHQIVNLTRVCNLHANRGCATKWAEAQWTTRRRKGSGFENKSFD